MRYLLKPLLLSLAMLAAFAPHVSAQTDTTTEAPAADAPATDPAAAPAAEGADAFNMGTSVVGSTYTKEVSGDWEVRCIRTESGADPCQMYQLLKDQTGNSVAEFSMVALTEGDAVAGATVITPLETLLTQQITITVDTGNAKRYPFTWCSANGCFARIGFTVEELNALKNGSAATIVIVPVAAPDQQVTLTLSLTGFTNAFTSMAAMNEIADAARKAALDAAPADAPAEPAPADGN
jgi:invasion protein IalB